MNQYTIKQVKSGNTVVEKDELTSYAKKNEVANIIDLEGLKDAIDSKVSITPQHTHKLADIDQLEAMMNDKLDCKTKYSYKTILSDSEKIEHLTNPSIDTLDVGGKYVFSVSDAGDLLIKYRMSSESSDVTLIGSFNPSSNNWILNGLNINEFKNNVEEVLKNHYEAIMALKPEYTDPTPGDNMLN